MGLMDRILGKEEETEKFSHLGILGYKLIIETSGGTYVIHTDTGNFIKEDQRLDRLSFLDVPNDELCKVKCLIDNKHELELFLSGDELGILEDQIYRLTQGDSYTLDDIDRIKEKIIYERHQRNSDTFPVSYTETSPVSFSNVTIESNPKLAMTVNDDMSYCIYYGNQQYFSLPDNFRLFKYLSKKLPDALIKKEDIDLIDLSDRYVNRKF